MEGEAHETLVVGVLVRMRVGSLLLLDCSGFALTIYHAHIIRQYRFSLIRIYRTTSERIYKDDVCHDPHVIFARGRRFDM